MHFLIIAIALVSLVFGPQLWARYTFQRYAKPLKRISGTGGELARHLLDRFDMEDVQAEETEPGGDHYDPVSKTVRLSPDNYKNNSLTAVAVATHEVGHAIQHQRNEASLKLRTRLVRLAQSAQQIGAGAMFIVPIVMMITRIPSTGILFALLGLLSIGSATLVHLVTLPVELDASFGKALPILQQGEYIKAEDEMAIRRILKAAALTYVAASLASLLNIWRWLALLRRA